MENVKVIFLGEEYLISRQLPKFVDILEEFKGYKDLLLGKVAEQAKKNEGSKDACEDFDYWREPVEGIAKNIIRNAADEDVYDLTLFELIGENPGSLLLGLTSGPEEEDGRRMRKKSHYPDCGGAVSELVSYMLDIYLTKLEQAGALDYGQMKKYSLPASSEIVKNLQVVSQKEKVLRKAFEKCPYNPDVYKALIDLGRVDFETFATAKYLRQDRILLKFIKEYCKRGAQNSMDVEEAVRVWAAFEGSKTGEVYRKIYGRMAKLAADRYRFAVLAINERVWCKKWIVENITKKASDLFRIKDSIPCIVKRTVREIMDEKTYDKLLELGMLDADKFNLSNEEACGYEPVLKNLTDKLIRQIDLVIGDLALERRSLASEILELKGDIMMKEEELHSLEETQNQKIAKLRSEKSRFAFLSLYKKKKWRAIIEAAVEEKERRVSAMILELDRMKKECEDKEYDLENIQNDGEFSSVQDWQTGNIYR